jgi:Bacterial Ig-like domain
MLAHWNAPDSVTPPSAQAQMFGDSAGWYQDASYTRLGQTGDVTPWMQIAGPASLVTDTVCTASLTGGQSSIRDLTGNALGPLSWSFLTGPAPTATVDPRSGATGVDRSTKVTAAFSEPVTGVSDSTFTLRNTANGTMVQARLRQKGNNNQWVLDPRNRLDANTSYPATLSGGPAAIRDKAGNPCNTMSWTFQDTSLRQRRGRKVTTPDRTGPGSFGGHAQARGRPSEASPRSRLCFGATSSSPFENLIGSP